MENMKRIGATNQIRKTALVGPKFILLFITELKVSDKGVRYRCELTVSGLSVSYGVIAIQSVLPFNQY